MNEPVKPVYFKTPSDFREWLMQNHNKEKELLVGFYKVSSNKPSIPWSESVDQAICFGWIDGVRESIDDERYCIRFSPRKPTSIWSAINIKKVEDLTGKGLMHQSGIEVFKKRKEAVVLHKDFEKKFKANKKAWQFFHNMPPSYKRTAIHWVMSAKREETKRKRLEELIKDSEERRKIKQLNY